MSLLHSVEELCLHCCTLSYGYVVVDLDQELELPLFEWTKLDRRLYSLSIVRHCRSVGVEQTHHWLNIAGFSLKLSCDEQRTPFVNRPYL
jgi:hypothetical protein